MSETHAETQTPRPRDAKGAPVGPVNDQSALNGGSMTHLYREGAQERRRPFLTRARVSVGVVIFGGLLIGLALLGGSA